jgi:tripartite-type tricarboxylate transporter receptor subunit TctC
MKLRIRLVPLLASAIALSASPARAQSYPSKPIRWVVPYTPGGLTDNVTRMVTTKLQEALGQPVTIDNRPGSNSIVGSDAVAKAAPDGYTFLTVIAALAANATLYAGKLPYDTQKSLMPVSLVGVAPLIITAGPAFAPKSVGEFVALAKANPGKVNFGSSGIGSAAHLTSELLAQTTGTGMVHVPYKGTAPSLQGLLGSEIQVMVDVPSSMMPHVRAGRIKALGIFSARRLVSAPDVPTILESGGPAIESATWVMFLAPAGTPAEIVHRIATETQKIVAEPDMRGRFEAQGIEVTAGTPADAAKYLDAEIAKWAKVITTANVKPE